MKFLHIQIFFWLKYGNKIIAEPSIYKYLKENKIKNLICGKTEIISKYPNDIAYNICTVGNLAIHNFLYTDKIILQQINENGLEHINVKQGYTNCSIAVIDDKSCITSNVKIAQKLKEKGITVLLISDRNEEIIRLIKNDGTYSSMHGFIGGCFGKIENRIILFGDINKFYEADKISEFIKNQGYELVYFENEEIIDYGGFIIVWQGGKIWKIY